ncbi:10899_t:CDS:2 [Funneliformis geosporum]|nr:10899_t:CDS:2 [Funneliformis geosporum]
MRRISSNIREDAKVSVLGSVVENEIEVSAGCIKFVAFSTTSSDTNQDTSNEERISGSETDISSNSDDSFKNGEAIDVLVHIADISNATPRQFFERFISVDFIMSVVIPFTNRCLCECEHGWSNLTWPEFMKFIGILTIMTYVKCANICDYGSIKQETTGVSLAFNISTNNDPFHFAQQFHDEFNENLTKAILPGPFQRKIPRKPHPIRCEFKGLADAQINLFLRLDLAEPLEYAMKNFSDQYAAVVASMLRLPKNISNDITGVLENTYGSFISRVCKISDVDLTGYGNATFCRPIVFDEYNEFRSAVNILNNLHDNSLSYHDILGSKRSADHVFAFYLTVAEANSFSAYCRFVLGKKNMKHVDFRKQLAKSIFNCYSDNTIAD